jgi:hypothetical protein
MSAHSFISVPSRHSTLANLLHFSSLLYYKCYHKSVVLFLCDVIYLTFTARDGLLALSLAGCSVMLNWLISWLINLSFSTLISYLFCKILYLFCYTLLHIARVPCYVYY